MIKAILLAVLLLGGVVSAQGPSSQGIPVEKLFPGAVAVADTPKGISRGALKARIQKLQAERAQLIANLNAYDGAIQEAEYWLKQLEENPQKGE